MGLMINPQTSYLLQENLTSLHAESKSWIEEIEFWRDELAFLFKIVHSKVASDGFPTVEISGFDKKLISINSESIERLKAQVQHHEDTLVNVLQSTSMDDEDKYRITHRDLHRKIVESKVIVRNFKKEIYALIRQYER